MEGITFVIDRRLASESGQIKVDYQENGVYGGFRITPAQEPPLMSQGEACSCSC